MIPLDCHPERREAATQRMNFARLGFQSLIDLIGQPTIRQPEMFRFAQHDTCTAVRVFS
jgi:hypothetical protein